MKTFSNQLFNIGIVGDETALNTLRHRTLNIINIIFITLMGLVVISRLFNSQFDVDFLNSAFIIVACIALFWSYQGNLDRSILLSSFIVTFLGLMLVFFELLKPLQLIPQATLLMGIFILIYRNRTSRYLFLLYCLTLLFLIFLKYEYPIFNTLISISQIFGISLAFIYFVNYLELQDKSLKNTIISLENSNLQKEELNHALREKNEELSTFTHIISHDLKSPITGIISYANLIEREVSFEDKAKEYLDDLVTSANTMNQLIEDLLLYSSLELRNDTGFEVVDLTLLVKEILESYNIKSIEKELLLEVGDLSTIYGNKKLINTLFHNLISNAFKYQPKDQPQHIPSIFINTKLTDLSQRMILVRDNGIGRKEEDIENLFTPFRRFHSS